MADKILIMDEGKVKQIDTPKNILKHPEGEFVKTFVVDNLINRINLLNELTKYKEGTKHE